jgi:hypothetical protein
MGQSLISAVTARLNAQLSEDNICSNPGRGPVVGYELIIEVGEIVLFWAVWSVTVTCQ